VSRLRIRVISESEFTVQGHGVHTAYVELTRALQKRADVQIFKNRRGQADITHIHTIGFYSLGYLLFSSGKKVVSAHVIPASFVGSLVGTRYWLPIVSRYVCWFYNRADLVLAVSEQTKAELRDLGVTRPIEVFCNVIDTSRYRHSPKEKAFARRALNIPPNAWVVVGNGQVQPRKRISSFVAMARALPDMQFVWVGGMPFGKAAADYEEMQQIMATPPSNVRFTGVVALKEVRRYFWAADAFVLPSVQETFGLAVLEAAASGLPLVLRDIHDYDATFRPYAVMCDEDGFVPALKKLRDDPLYYRKLTALARDMAAQYDAAAGAERLVKVFRDLL